MTPVYLKSFSFPGELREADYIRSLKRTCYNGVYPFKIFPLKGLDDLEFSPITIFCGGNGSGKSTILNLISEKLGLLRHSAFSGGAFFTPFVELCSVECEEQINYVAERVKAAGATFLRGGAFKPRTSPYAFQGLKAEGLDLLKGARKKTGLPIVTEIMSAAHIDMFESVDIIQVGARNMQNFELLKQLGKTNKPILLKRGLANTIEEWIMSAEYIMAGGNDKVILCERGIRTYETATRNTLDLSAVPVVKKLSHLPVIVDPSHATGKSSLVEPMALAAVAAGADGLMIEVHNDPKRALSDGAQSLTPEQFDEVARKVFALKKAYDDIMKA